MAFRQNDQHFSTKALHVGQEPEQWTSMAVVPPISLSTTFKQDGPADYKKYEYGRSGNPTRDVLEKCLASLDGAKHGITFSSGLAATTTITHLLNAGDHIVSMDDLYGGTNRYFRKVASRMNIETSFVDATDPAKVAAALRPNTKMVWIETPTNPTLKVVDVRAVADVLKDRKDIFLVVDNTFESAYFQRPLELGADISYYSLTKYMNGHSDVIMGALTTNSDDLHERLRYLQNAIGPVPSPFDCYLVNRSLKTLRLRMEQHQKNSLEVGRWLEKHPAVESVLHPGLPSHPQHHIVLKQCYGHSGMISFYLKGKLAESRKLLSSLKLVTLAESLGGYESLAELPYLMTHASIEEKERVALGVTENLIRVSVGLEDVNDIIEDLDQALRAAVKC
ncbi:cystathionine gamma-lyase [Eurytemora carolleeae]|uniref:cystathionine gamma-lyase n=1 Tax=Eurytemora carolleeae TaxID=1294199 RepID=UPI000C78D05C|nr:cystathionine gamma-lyase [Eurytemora carolleeae]|eukprot:XP_023325119.1 cystathionine gamma-lyase-like [Eurytemora affinis]